MLIFPKRIKKKKSEKLELNIFHDNNIQLHDKLLLSNTIL